MLINLINSSSFEHVLFVIFVKHAYVIQKLRRKNQSGQILKQKTQHMPDIGAGHYVGLGSSSRFHELPLSFFALLTLSLLSNLQIISMFDKGYCRK